MQGGLVTRIEVAGTFQNNIESVVGMRNCRWVAFMRHRDAAAPNIHPVIAMADGGAGTSVDRVEFIQMR